MNQREPKPVRPAFGPSCEPNTPSDWQDGRGRPGDKAWLYDRDLCRVLRKGTINRVGVKNEYGLPLNVEITWDDGTHEIWPPYSRLWDMNARHVLLLVPETRPAWPRELLEWIEAERLAIVIDPHHGDAMRYAMFCPACGQTLYLQMRSVESAALNLDEDGEVCQGKPLLENGSRECACACGRASAYEPPLEINDYQ
jgi:hypothetical protein